MFEATHVEERTRRRGPTQEQLVQDWRFFRFRTLGAVPASAWRLARSGADHHLYERMLSAGCPPDVAEDILL